MGKTEKGEARDWAEYLTQLSNCRARHFGESLEFLAFENKTATCDERDYENSLKSAYEIETGDIKEVKSKLKAYRQKSKGKRENEKEKKKKKWENPPLGGGGVSGPGHFPH